ncbi:hypothetical protein ACPXCP_41075 [Streptomyces sp. DT20]|uniref:hypothetical protein n=1 Tax=Streptomyces sp. DT20 TaxID=3416519 RepID=UPI003CF4E58E
MTIAVESMVPQYVWTANNALAFTPRSMPPAAYPILLHLLGRQAPGGRCVATQDAIAEFVGLSRSMVTRGLQHLGFAQMVWKVGNGVYQISPLIAGYRTPADQLAAIGMMEDDDRFDHPDFQERYELRVAQYNTERQEKAARRQRPTEPIDLASRRKRR